MPKKHFIADGTTLVTALKASAGFIFNIDCWNHTATSDRYLKLYDVKTAPSLGTTVPDLVFLIPPLQYGGRFDKDFSRGLAFTNGIWFSINQNPADNDNTAPASGDCGINFDFS